MTAVASPPSLQPLERLGWNTEEGQSDGAAVNAEEVSRVFIPKKILQRSNSSSSISSDSSTNTTISTNPSTGTSASEISAAGSVSVARGGKAPVPAPEKEQSGGPRKTKSLWPTAKSEGAFGGAAAGAGRPLNFSVNNGIAGPMHQALSYSPQDNMQNAQQVGGGRPVPQHGGGNEPQALLILVPTNATFDRKSISVPIFPDILRIGRQTNAKTIPTATNGYFDSKVLSRQHAEVWADRNGKIWIRDVKSSNGTFVNGQRLSPESRDSEPHELRENDSLELGIDIVSEDQKSIVHHKVSAKIEHAGFPNSSANVMDLTFGDLDPGASSGLLTSMPNGLGPRPRLGSQGSIGSNGSRFEPQSALLRSAGALGVQRHMNAFLSPVTVETVMRKINTELRQAKQQSQDLDKTGEFFNALLATKPGQDPPKAPASILPQKAPPATQSLTNGLALPPKADHLSPFSAPPAPPPQLPLPEKPDGPRSAHVESSTGSLPFKRASLDLPLIPNGKVDGPNSGQIISLVETLQTTKRELDIQGNRVRELEELLKRERKAREVAEERARLLSSNGNSTPDQVTAFTPPEDDRTLPWTNGHDETDSDVSDTASEADTVIMDLGPRSLADANDLKVETNKASSSVSSIQEKLNRMVHDMEEMKRQLEQQRSRADTAETERDNLVDMVQRIRQADAAAAVKTSPRKNKAGKILPSLLLSDDADASTPTALEVDELHSNEADEIRDIARQATAIATANGKPPGPGSEAAKDRQIHELQESLAIALARAQSKDHSMSQSAPYISMVGVVLLGVSAMLYLNGWQKVDR